MKNQGTAVSLQTQARKKRLLQRTYEFGAHLGRLWLKIMSLHQHRSGRIVQRTTRSAESDNEKSRNARKRTGAREHSENQSSFRKRPQLRTRRKEGEAIRSGRRKMQSHTHGEARIDDSWRIQSGRSVELLQRTAESNCFRVLRTPGRTERPERLQNPTLEIRPKSGAEE